MSPSLVFHDGQGFLIGNGLGADYWTEMGLRLSRLDGRSLPAPSREGLSFIMPVAGFDQRGKLNFFWAEPRRDLEAPPGIREPLYLERLFHAVFQGEDNEAWLDGKRIVWSVANPIYASEETIIWRGDTWERPILVSRSGLAQAHFVRAAVTTSGQVHLVWLKNLSGSHILEVLWHSISEDGGRTWSEPREIAAPDGNPYGLRVAADSSGALHVVFVSTNERPHDALYYVTWDRGEWSTPCVVDPDFPVAHAVSAIAADEDGRVHLVWNRGSQAERSNDSDAVAVRSVLRSSLDRGGRDAPG